VIQVKRAIIAVCLAVSLAAAPTMAGDFRDATCAICKKTNGDSQAACTLCMAMIVFDFFGGW
jgi:hypothetical protein